MKTTKISIFETNLITGVKKPVKLIIYDWNNPKIYLNKESIDQNKQGDIYQANGVIRYVWNKVPSCLLYRQNRTTATTSLSYK